MNPCLRPACLSDLPPGKSGHWVTRPNAIYRSLEPVWIESFVLRWLYDAEWRKRGFERSP